jgi:hypothetical protein
MTEEKIYLFDLNGFIVLKAVVKSKWIVAANAEQTRRFRYTLEPGPAFVLSMDVPEVLDVIKRVTGVANGLIQERFHAPLGRLPRQVPTAAPGSGHGEKNIRASSGEMSAVNFRRR